MHTLNGWDLGFAILLVLNCIVGVIDIFGWRRYSRRAAELESRVAADMARLRVDLSLPAQLGWGKK